MRRIISGIIALAMTLSLCGAFAVFAENDADTITPIIKVDGIELAFGENEAKPIYYQNDGRNVIPLRKVAEALDAAVYWFEADQRIQIVTEDRSIVFSVEDDMSNYVGVYEIDKNADGWQSAFVKDITLDGVAPYVDENTCTTYVPLRAAADLLLVSMKTLKRKDITNIAEFNDTNITDDKILTWDESTHTVSIPKRNVNLKGGYAQGTIKMNETGELYLEAQDGNFKFTNIPDEENFWSYLLAVPDNNPVGTEVIITGYITDNNEIPLRRSVVSIRRVRPTVSLNSDVDLISLVKDPNVSPSDVNNKVANGTQVPINSKLYLKADKLMMSYYIINGNTEFTFSEEDYDGYASFCVGTESVNINVVLNKEMQAKSSPTPSPSSTPGEIVIVTPSSAPSAEAASPQPDASSAPAASAVPAAPAGSAEPSPSPSPVK